MSVPRPILEPVAAPTPAPAAAPDVFNEDLLPHGHPLYERENVLLSPQYADHTPDWLDQAMQFFIAQLERFRKGDSLLNVVEKKPGY